MGDSIQWDTIKGGTHIGGILMPIEALCNVEEVVWPTK